MGGCTKSEHYAHPYTFTVELDDLSAIIVAAGGPMGGNESADHDIDNNSNSGVGTLN